MVQLQENAPITWAVLFILSTATEEIAQRSRVARARPRLEPWALGLLLTAHNMHLPKSHSLLTCETKFCSWIKQGTKVTTGRDTGLSRLSLASEEPEHGGDSHPDLGTGEGSGDTLEISQRGHDTTFIYLSAEIWNVWVQGNCLFWTYKFTNQPVSGIQLINAN